MFYRTHVQRDTLFRSLPEVHVHVRGLGCHMCSSSEPRAGGGVPRLLVVHLLAARPQVSASGGFVTRLGDASQSRRRPALGHGLGHQGHDQGAEGGQGSQGAHINATNGLPLVLCRTFPFPATRSAVLKSGDAHRTYTEPLARKQCRTSSTGCRMCRVNVHTVSGRTIT